jgi:hypothetical protein
MMCLRCKELEDGNGVLAYLKALRPVKAFFLCLLQYQEDFPEQFHSSRFRRSHIFAVSAA